MNIFVLGKTPPPIGGVTIHVQRLIEWLKQDKSLKVEHFDITIKQIIGLMSKLLIYKNKIVVVHCQTSSIFGPTILVFIKKLFNLKYKIIYSVHSELWIGKNLGKGNLRKQLSLFSLRNINNLISDNINIKKNFEDYGFKSNVIIPFLPPLGYLDDSSLQNYLKIENELDKPILIFNAYKVNYKENDPDIYGLETLLNAFFLIDTPVTLILLIPQLLKHQEDKIKLDISEKSNNLNKPRIHIISRTDIEGWKVIAKSNLFVRPTITDGDALSIREALFYGVPVVTSDCTVRPQGVTLFKTGDHFDLAEKIMDKVSNIQSQNIPPPKMNINPAKNFIDIYKYSTSQIGD